MDIEKVEEFYEFLKGTVPKNMYIKFPPKLSQNKAFTIIWYLQEHLKIIPDIYEQCCSCKNIYDTREEGIYIEKSKRNYCEGCRPD